MILMLAVAADDAAAAIVTFDVVYSAARAYERDARHMLMAMLQECALPRRFSTY